MQLAAFSPVETRRGPSRVAPISLLVVVGLTLASLATIGCGVDNSGLNSSGPKLQRDGSAGGMVGKVDGAAQDAASSGGGAGRAVSGAGGGVGAMVGSSTGDAGTSGGSLGGKGISPTGAAGAGSGGTAGAGSGGTTGAAGVVGLAGASGAAGNAGEAGANGEAGVDGAAGTVGMAGVSGAAGLGGAAGGSGTAGTIGAAGQGGTGGIGQGGSDGVGGSMGGRGGFGGQAGRGGTCRPNNCADGCCANNQCVRNTTARQCGTMGAACAACAPCELCSTEGQCAIDPTSQWTITADSAQIARTPPRGGTWDPPFGEGGGSAPDPFCRFENPPGTVTAETAGVTSTATDEYFVTWNQVITPADESVDASVLMADNPVWQIWVGDEDCGAAGNQSICGSFGQTVCSYQQPITAAALQSGMLEIDNFQSCVSLTLSFNCQGSGATTAASP